MSHPIDQKLSGFDYVKLFIQGFCIGIANAIPGISGGTIAFIFGIYEDLINSIKSFDGKFLKNIITLNFKELFNGIAWRFTMCVFSGALVALILLSKPIVFMLEKYPVYLNSFFFGLILATIPIIAKVINKWTFSKILIAIIASLATYFLLRLVPINTPNNLFFIFSIAAISISAMILPGISGAFILVLLGKYQYILDAINERNLLILFIFGLGILFGIISFVRILSFLFKKFHDITVVIITGIVIGSLYKIWPWKNTLESIISRSGKIIPIKQINYIPTVINNELMFAVILTFLGFFLALKLNKSPKTKIL